jgi:hypothetical protein
MTIKGMQRIGHKLGLPLMPGVRLYKQQTKKSVRKTL